MKARWFPVCTIESLEDGTEIVPTSSGIYMILGSSPIHRVRGKDFAGILYIGKAINLQRRIYQFWDGYHSASGFLYQHPAIANKLFEKKIRLEDDIYKNLGKLRFRTSYPIHKRSLGRAERAALFAYVKRYGEAPPLNLNLAERWKDPPPVNDIRWAEKGILIKL